VNIVPQGYIRMNDLGTRGQPFFFLIGFEPENPIIVMPEDAASEGIFYKVGDFSNPLPGSTPRGPFFFRKHPVPYSLYYKSFQKVQRHIRAGNSYLVNLTFPTPIETDLTLADIYLRSQAKYKLLYKDEFVVFSPEQFVQIENRRISTFPMKGTIEASIPRAREIILSDQKELAEHTTIVDLLRNDLNRVARQVRVSRFRYVENIETNFSSLLQVSSEITGILPPEYPSQIGEILYFMLPAGSVTGAPKKKTVDIIRDSEIYQRGFYTGIFGFFDGKNLDSGVMIRFIERHKDGYVYKSGGGITFLSDPHAEYQELIEKVYVPFT